MFKIIRNIKARIARKEQAKHCAWLESIISVKERDGRLWLTCDGVAVSMFPDNTDAATITRAVEETRLCAVSYHAGYEPECGLDDADLLGHAFIVDNCRNGKEGY